MKLERVCRHWREVAQRTPLLWSRLAVVIVTGGNAAMVEREDTRVVKIIRTIMSYNTPLSIAFQSNRRSDLVSEECCSMFLDGNI